MLQRSRMHSCTLPLEAVSLGASVHQAISQYTSKQTNKAAPAATKSYAGVDVMIPSRGKACFVLDYAHLTLSLWLPVWGWEARCDSSDILA